jgi:hypothetical protein
MAEGRQSNSFLFTGNSDTILSLVSNFLGVQIVTQVDSILAGRARLRDKADASPSV